MKGVLKLEDGRELTVELNDETLDRLKEPKRRGMKGLILENNIIR